MCTSHNNTRLVNVRLVGFSMDSWQFVLPVSVGFEGLTVGITNTFRIKAAEQVLLCLKGKEEMNLTLRLNGRRGG